MSDCVRLVARGEREEEAEDDVDRMVLREHAADLLPNALGEGVQAEAGVGGHGLGDVIVVVLV